MSLILSRSADAPPMQWLPNGRGFAMTTFREPERFTRWHSGRPEGALFWHCDTKSVPSGRPLRDGGGRQVPLIWLRREKARANLIYHNARSPGEEIRDSPFGMK